MCMKSESDSAARSSALFAKAFFNAFGVLKLSDDSLECEYLFSDSLKAFFGFGVSTSISLFDLLEIGASSISTSSDCVMYVSNMKVSLCSLFENEYKVNNYPFDAKDGYATFS